MRHIPFETLFTSWSIKFQFVEEMNLDAIQRIEEAQVREIAHIAIPANVEKYAIQMQAGAQFPPVVIWEGKMIDGNTRLAAAKRVGRASFPVYKVELPSLQLAKMLAAALNSMAGEGLSAAEARRAALDFIEQGFTDAQIAMHLGVTAESARQWRRLSEVDARAERTGTTDQIAKLPKNVRLELAKITHDQPFRDLALAVSETGPDVKDIRPVVAQVKDATSDDAAVALIATARQEWTPVGPAPAKHRPNRQAQQARMHIGGLLKCDPAQLVESGKTERDLERFEALAVFVNRVIEVLREQAAA